MGASESKQPLVTSEEDGDWVVITMDAFTGEDPQVKCDGGIEMQTVAPPAGVPVPQHLVTMQLENGFICTTSEVTLTLFVRTSGIRVTHVLQKGVWAPLTPQHAQCPLPSRAAMMAAVRATLTPSGREMLAERRTFGGMSYEEWFEHAHFAARVKKGLERRTPSPLTLK